MKPRILAIRGGAIGDFVLTLPALRLLRENFADCHIELLGYPHIASLALHGGPGPGRTYLDAVRNIEARTLAGFFARNASLDPALCEYFAGFQQVVSWLFDPDGIFEGNLRRAGVKHFISTYAPITGRAHASVQLAHGLGKLALFSDNSAPVLVPDDRHAALADEWFRAGLSTVAVHIGSGSPAKNWPVGRWVELANALATRHDRLIAIVGEAEDNALETAFVFGYAGPAIRIAKSEPLPMLAAILARCAAYYGHDTGISHIAAASGTPCTVIFGPTDPAIWAPQGPHVRVIRAPGGNLAALSAAEVFDQDFSGRERGRRTMAPAGGRKSSR